MERLNWDVIENILSRASVKYLLRFRCVSKAFCSLISSQEFIKIHLKRSVKTNSNLSIILSDSQCPFTDCSRYWMGKIFSASLDSLDFGVELDHPFKNCKESTTIIDSCNGLIALRNHKYDIALWNPSTKKHLILPKFWPDVKHGDFVDGFGYDGVTDDYKVVRFLKFDSKSDLFTEIAVYSLKTNSSSRARLGFPCYIRRRFDGTFANSHVHWLATISPEACIEDVIIAFDLKSEQFHGVRLPIEKPIFSMYVGNFSGCLYFNCHTTGCLDIWVMKESSWTKSFSLPEDVHEFCAYLKALVYSKDGDEVLLDTYEFDGDEDISNWELYWYDLQNQRALGLGTIHGCLEVVVVQLFVWIVLFP